MTGAEERGSLTAIFRRLIAQEGPISLLHYMGEANARYYDSRDPLGGAGDFITAPEISQMFGELVGLWLVDIWARAGRPRPVHYVELGPGRGTLARDAMRAARRHGLEPQLHFVESSRTLRAVQQHAFPNAIHHDDLASVPEDAPVLLVANEFLDALPIRQLVMTPQGWRERLVGLDDGADGGLDGGPDETGFRPVAGGPPMDAAVPPARRVAPIGTIIETCPGAAAVVAETARRLRAQEGAALFIDYGHASPRHGSTLQALRGHRRADPFRHPGEADLTAHVDFATLAEVARAGGCRWLGTCGQGEWLRALGIDARAASLSRAAPEQAEAIGAARDRLVAPGEMGELFKVMALAAPGWPDGAGFRPG